MNMSEHAIYYVNIYFMYYLTASKTNSPEDNSHEVNSQSPAPFTTRRASRLRQAPAYKILSEKKSDAAMRRR